MLVGTCLAHNHLTEYLKNIFSSFSTRLYRITQLIWPNAAFCTTGDKSVAWLNSTIQSLKFNHYHQIRFLRLDKDSQHWPLRGLYEQHSFMSLKCRMIFSHCKHDWWIDSWWAISRQLSFWKKKWWVHWPFSGQHAGLSFQSWEVWTLISHYRNHALQVLPLPACIAAENSQILLLTLNITLLLCSLHCLPKYWRSSTFEQWCCISKSLLAFSIKIFFFLNYTFLIKK